MSALSWRDGPPLAAALRVTRNDADGVYIVAGSAGAWRDHRPLDDVQLLLDEGIAVTRDRAYCRWTPGGLMPWLHQLLERGPLQVPLGEVGTPARRPCWLPARRMCADLPDELRTAVVDVTPVPHLVLRSPRQEARLLQADLLFSYDGGPPAACVNGPARADARSAGDGAPQADGRAPARTIGCGHSARGPRGTRGSGDRSCRSRRAMCPVSCGCSIREGWHVEADGHRYRLATTAPRLDVQSGVDWFELRGDAVFDEQTAHASAVARRRPAPPGHRAPGRRERRHSARGLAARVRDARTRNAGRAITSGSGARRWRCSMRCSRSSRPSRGTRPPRAARDRLRGVRRRLRRSIRRHRFTGTLREYQREALGWLTFLREFGFGGCLADDMGLGKTVMVLALLDARPRRIAAGTDTAAVARRRAAFAACSTGSRRRRGSRRS